MTLPTPIPVARLGATTRFLAAVCAVLVAVCATLVALLALAAAPAAAANPAPTGSPIGHVDSVAATKSGALTISGWAADPDDVTKNVTTYGLVDGRIAARTVTSIARPAITARNKVGPTPGFLLSVPVPSGSHVVCVGVLNIGGGLSALLSCTGVPLGSAIPSTGHSPVGALTSASATASTVHVTGWAAEPDFLARRLTTVLYIDGSPAITVSTRSASAAQRRAGAGRLGSIDITVPVAAGAHLACVWLVNIGPGSNTSLGCQAVDTRGPAGTGTVSTPAVNKAVVKEAKTHIGQQYVWGATGPKTFDCSGLVMYSYGKQKVMTPRVSEAQFGAARLIPAARAVPGDLVFWHDGVGDVYHVGIYLSPGLTVAAIDESEGVDYQKLWDTSIVTYGSFTHS